MFETKRLILRELRLSDVDALYKVLGDTSIMQYYPYTFNKQKVKQRIKNNIARYKNDGFGLYAVILKSNGELIGDCGLTLQNIDNKIVPEIGYHIRKDKQRQGYAKEACIVIRDYAFAYKRYNEVYSYMHKENIPSIKTAISYDAKHIKDYKGEDEIISSVYKLNRKQWLNITINRKYQKEILEYLRTIPKAKVVTYGSIAEYLGNKKLSRIVGNALHNNSDPFYYPCYKVVNCKGELAKNFGGGGIEVQKQRLVNDGVEVIDYKVDLDKYLYKK